MIANPSRKKRGPRAAGPRSFLLALALVLAAPAAARAQAPGAHAKAEAQFKSGRAAMDRGDCKTALEHFQQSQTLEPGRGKLLNMAICEDRLGMVVKAVGHFLEVQKQFPADDDRRPIVDDYLKKLTPKVSLLRIDLAPDAPTGAEVSLDGAPLDRARLGADIALDPGKHVVLVTAPGAPESRIERMLKVGTRSKLSVGGGGAVDQEPDPTPGPTPDVAPKKSLVPAIVLGGAGVLGIAIGAGLAGAYAGKRSEAEQLHQDILDDGRTCAEGAPNFAKMRCPKLKDAALAGDSFSAGSIAGFVIGGVAAAGAVGYMLFWPAPKAPPSTETSIHLAPVVTADHQGIAVWGSF